MLQVKYFTKRRRKVLEALHIGSAVLRRQLLRDLCLPKMIFNILQLKTHCFTSNRFSPFNYPFKGQNIYFYFYP